MKKIFLDTNIVLDFALRREPFYSNSLEILHLANEKKFLGYISASSVTDIYYFLSKSKGINNAKQFLTSFFNLIDILNVDKTMILEALNSNFKDFEDAVQNFSAEWNNIDIILTRNPDDFVGSQLRILTPESFLAEIN